VSGRRPLGAGRRRRPPAKVLARRWGALLGGLGLAAGIPAALASAPGARARPASAGGAPSVGLAAALAPWRLPAPTSRPVVLALAGRIAVLGGLTVGDVSTASAVLVDPRTARTARSSPLVEAVHDAAGALLGGRAVVFGGGAAVSVATVQSWQPGASRPIGELPTPRSDLGAATLGRRAYLVGGYDGASLPAEVLVTTNGASFRPAGRLAQPVRYAAVAAYRGALWVVGGEVDASGTVETADIQRFDPATGTARVVGHLPVPLAGASAFVLGHRLYVAGGRLGATASARIWWIDTRHGVARPAGFLPAGRADAGVAVLGGRAYLVGGESLPSGQALRTAVVVRVVDIRRA